MRNFVLIILSGFAALALVSCSDRSQLAQDKGAAANSAANDSARRPLGPQTRLILAFGDSLFAGYGLAPDQGFAPELERALTQMGRDVRVHNGGVSGDTTAAALARLAFTLDGLPRKPDLVIVGLGGNDMLRGLAPEQTRANMAAILAELDRRGIPVMLTGMRASPNMGAEYGAAFNPIFPDLARAHDAELYPFFLNGVVGQANLILADGIHPNDRGIDVVVARVAPVVARVLLAP